VDTLFHDCFTPAERVPVPTRQQVGVDLRAGMDAVEMGKLLSLLGIEPLLSSLQLSLKLGKL
jgi:hypothetical protein